MKDWPKDDAIARLAAATRVARDWPADRAEQRARFGDLIAAYRTALTDAILAWQDYQFTGARTPRVGTVAGATIADWLGERRWDDLVQINWRIAQLHSDILQLAELRAGDDAQDHVMLETAAKQLDAKVDDPGAHAARIAIQYLTDYVTQVKELEAELLA